MRWSVAALALCGMASLASLGALADDRAKPKGSRTRLPDGTARAKQHMAGFRLPAGLKVELFAAEPMLASPVAISVDEKGRVFVAEEYRLGRGAAENRGNPAFNFSFWLDDELQLRTTGDRLKMYKKWATRLPGGMNYFTNTSDQIRLVQDTKGKGRADKSTIFAKGFNHPLDGLAAGVLARNGDVYLTNIPHLWRLRDSKGTGVADSREKLLSGFGVNCAFYGHDLHGLIFGPDGKLYFSVGDRGFNVTSKEGKTFEGLRTGAVFRCDPDGSNFEVVMRGLRNPQELAFDQYGNLFADDNNCDKGDHARLVYIVEDGDSGWNMALQTIPAPYMAGPWFAEKMWHLPHAGQPAWIVPPVGKIGTGPSGFLFTSGTTLPERYKNSFIMCNYAGGRGLEAFRVKPKGAGFEIEDYHDFLRPIMATDVDQGPDGKLYVSDFVNLDWSGRSLGGRIYTVFDEKKVNSEEALRLKKFFAEGFDKLKNPQLAKLLGHADQKARLQAQWTLASRGIADPKARGEGSPWALLSKALEKGNPQLKRLHALWGLTQIATKVPGQTLPAHRFLEDDDSEVRAQAAKALGRLPSSEGRSSLVKSLSDPSARVRFFAAQSCGKLKLKEATGAIFQVLAENKDADPWLRHACITALARIGDLEALSARAKDPNASVRMGVVLALRKRVELGTSLGEGMSQSLDLLRAGFLKDRDALVRAEAARAIYDLPIEGLYPELAAILPNLSSSADPDATVRRAIGAAYRLGTAQMAQLVLGAASNPRLSPAVRAEAIACLRQWSNPPPRDRVHGRWRPLEKRDSAIVRGVVGPAFEKLLASANGPLLKEAVSLIGPLKLDVSEARLGGWIADSSKQASIRVAALRLLAERKAPSLRQSIDASLANGPPLLKAEARDVLAASDPSRAAELVIGVLAQKEASLVEKQRAIATLGRIKEASARQALEAWSKRLASGKVEPELQLDWLEAIRPSRSKIATANRRKFESKMASKFALSLKGGDAERGKVIFFGHAAAQCVRCHTVNGNGGAAGPDLTQVAKRYPEKTREFFLESLLKPSSKIAPGFGTVSLTLIDGRTVSGVLAAEDKKALTLQYPDGKKEMIPVGDVERRTTAASPMPAVDQVLSPREARDLIEYLSTLK